MARAKHPLAKEFYVYEFRVRRVPFYVGIGRANRDKDRIRYVRRQMVRKKSGMSSKWFLHTRVLAKLIDRGEKVEAHRTTQGLRRKEALALEKKRIRRLLSCGHVFANIHYNPSRPFSPEQAFQFIVRNRKCAAADLLALPRSELV
jgi:hypothetical protein